MQEVVLVSQKLELLEETSPLRPIHRAEWGFLLTLPYLRGQALLVKGGINARPEDSVCIQLIIFP